MTTGIEWCDETWNPVTGCTPVSAGCTNCWAKRMAARQAGRNGYPADLPFKPGTLHPDKFDQPVKWKKPRRIAVSLMGDLFHGAMDCLTFARIWAAMAAAPQHTYLLLTKRPGHALAIHNYLCLSWPENIWLGVSVENQETADQRIPELLKIPAAVRFISAEPLLGPVDLCCHLWPAITRQHGLHWVITGGESGPGARPMHPDWARGLRDQCAAAGVPFFFKQWGEWKRMVPINTSDARRAGAMDMQTKMFKWDFRHFERIGKKAAGRLLDGQLHQAFPQEECSPSGGIPWSSARQDGELFGMNFVPADPDSVPIRGPKENPNG